jgi:hypothetical protein
MTARNPRQVSSQNVNSERRKHEDRAYPEAPVGVHAPPVRTGIGFTAVAAYSFVVVLIPRQFLLLDAECMRDAVRCDPRFIVVVELLLLSLEPAG